MKKFESGSLASELLSDLKRKMMMQRWIIFLQWLLLLLLSLRRIDGRKAPWKQKPFGKVHFPRM